MNRFAAILPALLLSGPFLHLSMPMVLCVGSDGHVSLEGSSPDACCVTPAGSRSASISPALASASHSCGPCVDVCLAEYQKLGDRRGKTTAGSPDLATPAAEALRVAPAGSFLNARRFPLATHLAHVTSQRLLI